MLPLVLAGLITLSIILAAVAIRWHTSLRGERARAEALRGVGADERARLNGELDEARSIGAQLERELDEARDELGRIGRPGPSLVGRTLVVHTRDDKTFRGVLHGEYADRLTLRDAVLVTAIGEQPAGGLQHIPLANYAWAQELEPAQLRAVKERVA